jgi:RNA polymerase sigma-70 factor (ECF subfamily)
MNATAVPGPFIDDPPDATVAGRSFEAIYRDHVGFVWRNLRRLGVFEAEIEDAAHEVFMVVLRRLGEFDGRAAITTWLYSITRGIASNRRRGDRRRLRREADVPLPEGAQGPVELVERAQAAATVDRFLTTLSAEQRVVFEFIEIEGLQANEVAEILELNINTVYTRLRAARQRFAGFVAALHGHPGGANHG